VMAVVGLVFVSYGGLTKVDSAAEEVEDPSRRIPLGMAASLTVATLLYTLGVLVAVAVLPPEELHTDFAPIHSAAEAILPPFGAALVVIAALAAFASAVNAGILAAARYPMAMARDGLLPKGIGKISKFGTPIVGVISTGSAIAIVVLAFDAEAIAKLASSFVLLTLGLVNLAVLVLRASQIQSYAPSFRAPFYPFTQFVGIAISVYLIWQLGPTPQIFVVTVTAVAWTWHHFYATGRTKRAGAIRHVFERWGKEADRGLDREMSAAMAGHGLREADDYAGLIARASVLSAPENADITEAASRAATVLSQQIGLSSEKVTEQFLETGSLWIQPSKEHSTATPVAFFEDIESDYLVIVRSAQGTRIPASWGGSGERVNALFFLAGTNTNPGRSLRLAGELAQHLRSGTEEVGKAIDEVGVKSALLPEAALRQHTIFPEGLDSALINKKISDIELLEGAVIAAVVRNGISVEIHEELVIESDDQITVIGPLETMPPIGSPVPVIQK
ncbi:MAG: amino acid permease, partial [Actinomycetota bacterium]|nr:amino acid permease [Actinomycetota bacterium]